MRGDSPKNFLPEQEGEQEYDLSNLVSSFSFDQSMNIHSFA
jgi:hypothetical protein